MFVNVQHMREVAERRQQLELEHEQALAILKFKQDEIKRLQRVSPRTGPQGPHIRASAVWRSDTQSGLWAVMAMAGLTEQTGYRGFA